MVVKQATPGMSFDVDQILNAKEAKDFVGAGYVGVGRYFPRTPALIPGNLTGVEMSILLGAGLSVFGVQHTALPGWQPSAALGKEYGAFASKYAAQIGYPTGASIFCDLEEVGSGTTAQEVIDYFTAWYNEVTNAGFFAGLYVGWNIVLSDQQLWDLPVKSYWKAYNCDQSIPNRGWQIVQHTEKSLNAITYDPNTIQPDNKGDLPMWLSPS